MQIRSFLAAFALALSPLGAVAVDAPPPQAFFEAPDFADPVLSPDGKAIAALMRSDKGHQMLVVFDIDAPAKLVIAAVFDDADVDGVHWVDASRLVFRLRQGRDETLGNHGTGLFAVDRDGKDPRALILMREQFVSVKGTLAQSRSLTADHEFVRTLDDGSADVVVQRIAHEGLTAGDHWRLTSATPLRLNTRTGRATAIELGDGPVQASQWAIDGRGLARAAIVTDEHGSAVHLPDASGHWHRAGALPPSSALPTPQDIDIVGADGAIYLARTTPGADGVRTLHRLDANGVAAPLLAIKGFDFSGTLIEDLAQHRVLGARYDADASATAWFDPAMKQVQAKVDAKLPGMANLIQVARCGCGQRLLVTSLSDHDPGRYALYDPARDEVAPLSRARAAIDPRAMANTDFHRTTARDGADLPIYVTAPAGKGPWPAVVLVHAGPWLRGAVWGWDDEAQFLASRGYLVLQPEYRGSAGYGQAHLEAGFGQWGARIQDDLVDALRWARAKGLADPARACVVGSQFGGTAAVLALAHDPGVFRCAAARSALADIDDVVRVTWSDTSDAMRVNGLERLVGDPARDAARLAAASPVAVAGQVRGAVLLAHGTEDRRTPIGSATRLRRALVDAKVPVEWVEVAGETQAFAAPANRLAWYTRLATFLAAQIGPDAPR